MKATLMAMVALASFLVTWGIVEEDSLLRQAFAAGPIAVAAFAVGYAIDLLIFGAVVGRVAKWRAKRKAVAVEAE